MQRVIGFISLLRLFQLFQVLIFPGILFLLILAFFYEWIDRKFIAKLQNRVGPPWFQPFVDFVKLCAQEDIVPAAADKKLFAMSPILLLTLMLTSLFFIPITETAGILSFEGDIVIVMFILTLVVILKYISGWSSTDRFSSTGAERVILQLISYVLPLMFVAFATALAAGSFQISKIVEWTIDHSLFGTNPDWLLIIPMILGISIFILTMQAELEKIPFDIPEAETEIVAGWLTEFTGRKLAFFRLSVDLEMVLAAGLAAALFLGGPVGPVFVLVPGFEWFFYPFFYTIYFLVKSIFIILIISNLRGLFARFKIDQMVRGAWKFLLPLSILDVVIIQLLIL